MSSPIGRLNAQGYVVFAATLIDKTIHGTPATITLAVAFTTSLESVSVAQRRIPYQVATVTASSPQGKALQYYDSWALTLVEYQRRRAILGGEDLPVYTDKGGARVERTEDHSS